MKKAVLIAIIGVLCFQVSANAQYPDSTLLKDMVAFDQAFIPVLVYTNSNLQDSSRIAMKYLLPAWDKFKAADEHPIWPDSLWDPDIEMINHLINESDMLIVKDSNLHEAHLRLENVRTIFINMRERNDIEYYPDKLITFHALMEAILNIIQNTPPSELTQEQIEGIGIIVPQALSTWHNVERSKFDPALFGFSDQKVKILRQLIDQEQLSLSDLQNALGSGDKTAVINAAKSLRPAFLKIYMLFGNFDMKSG